MREKISHAIMLITVVVGIIAIWLCPNIIQWQTGIPYQPSDFFLIVWPRYCAVMIVTSVLCELRWRTPFPLKAGPWMGKVLLIAMLGGTISGEMIASHFQGHGFWRWIVMPFAMAIFGGVQTAMIGTLFTVFYLRSSLQTVKT